MTIPALAIAPVLTDRTGAAVRSRSLDVQLLERIARDDYDQWLFTALQAGLCAADPAARHCPRHRHRHRRDRLHAGHRGQSGQGDVPAVRDRRESVCPPCAETYRADTYQLIRSGLAGGKGTPESVAIHPCAFVTFTAPSFGPVHTRVETTGGKVSRPAGSPRTTPRFTPTSAPTRDG
jgi:hypothetical protein